MPGSTRHIEPLLPTGRGISPAGIASAEAWGTLLTAQRIAPGGIASAQAFGTATLVARGPTQTLAPTGIPSLQAFGSVRLGRALRPTGIPSAEAFGLPRVLHPRGADIILPSGIPSAEARGRPTVTPGSVSIFVVGIASTEVVDARTGIGHPVIAPRPTGTAPLPMMLVRRMGIRH